MQPVIQRRSYNSVRIFWLNKESLGENISECVKKMAARRPEVQKAVLFGSVAKDNQTVLSDVDILLVVSESRQRFIDRPLEYIDFFDGVGLSVDLFVYTKDEVEKNNISLAITALKNGKVLFERQNA